VGSVLWIAFRLYLWYIEHNEILRREIPVAVVNCFQIVSLIYWAQLPHRFSAFSLCCELLSDCIFDILSTTRRCNFLVFGQLWIAFRLYLWYIEHNWASVQVPSLPLWIAFRLYLWYIEHNHLISNTFCTLVVNCFQIVSLIYWAQPVFEVYDRAASCELLSDCIFDILSTTYGMCKPKEARLWIAFRLYLWYIEHN